MYPASHSPRVPASRKITSTSRSHPTQTTQIPPSFLILLHCPISPSDSRTKHRQLLIIYLSIWFIPLIQIHSQDHQGGSVHTVSLPIRRTQTMHRHQKPHTRGAASDHNGNNNQTTSPPSMKRPPFHRHTSSSSTSSTPSNKTTPPPTTTTSTASKKGSAIKSTRPPVYHRKSASAHQFHYRNKSHQSLGKLLGAGSGPASHPVNPEDEQLEMATSFLQYWYVWPSLFLSAYLWLRLCVYASRLIFVPCSCSSHIPRHIIICPAVLSLRVICLYVHGWRLS